MATRHWIGGASGAAGAFDTAANWLEEAVPTDGDDVIFRARALVDGTVGDQDLDDDLDQGTVLLGSLVIEQSYTGKIGLATEPLAIAAGTVKIGEHWGAEPPAGSPRINLQLTQMGSEIGPVVTVFNSSETSEETDLPPVRLVLDAHAPSDEAVVYVRKGWVGIAALGEVSAVDALHVSYVDRVQDDAAVVVGSGVTLTTLDQVGGDVTLLSAATTVTVTAGSLLTEGVGALTTLTVSGGTVVSNAAGTVAALNADGGIVDFLASRAARTVTTPKIAPGATLKYDPDVITFTNQLEATKAVVLTASAA